MRRFYHFAITDDSGERVVAETVRTFTDERKFHEVCAKICNELVRKYGPGKYWLATREIVGEELQFMLTGKLGRAVA